MTRLPLHASDLALLAEATALKEVARAGWTHIGVEHPESVAAHSYGVALAALVLAPPHLDRAKLLAMALLHDLAEVRVGDLTPRDAVPKAEKHRRESEAFDALLAGRPELRTLAEEALDGHSEEARFLKAIDRLDMRLTADHYAARGFEVEAFRASAQPAIAAVFDEGEKEPT